MSYRFFLGQAAAAPSVYDAAAPDGAELRELAKDFTGPFKLRVASGIAFSEVRAFFADDEWPQPGDFWQVDLPGDVVLEHPSLDDIRQAMERGR